MDVNCLRVVQRANLFQNLFRHIPCKPFPVLAALIQDEVKLESWLKILELLSQHDVFFLFICKQKNQLNVFILHINDLVNYLVTRGDSASSGHEEDPLGSCCKVVCNHYSAWLIVKFAKRTLNVDSVSHTQRFNPGGHFSAMRKYRMNIRSVNFEKHIDSFFLGTW